MLSSVVLSIISPLLQNTPAPAFKTDGGNKTGDSSLGLLDADAIKNISAFSDYDLSKENLQPTNNMSLGQYLQPGGMEESLASQPLSDSEEEEEAGVAVEERSGGFSWDQVVQANTGEEPALQQVSSVYPSLALLTTRRENSDLILDIAYWAL